MSSFLSFVCHFIVILLSFWERENGEKKLFKNDYHDRPFCYLVAAPKYKEQVEKLLESQPAVKKDRAGELALGNSFLGLPGRGVVLPAQGAGPAQKPGGGGGAGVKWPGGAAQAREAGPTWKLQKRNFTSTRVNLFSMFFAFSLHCFLHFFRIFLHFFRIFLHVFAFFLHFFAFFLHFPD